MCTDTARFGLVPKYQIEIPAVLAFRGGCWCVAGVQDVLRKAKVKAGKEN